MKVMLMPLAMAAIFFRTGILPQYNGCGAGDAFDITGIHEFGLEYFCGLRGEELLPTCSMRPWMTEAMVTSFSAIRSMIRSL